MGSGNSRLGGSPRKSKVNRSKHRLSSLLCGGASSSTSSSSSSSSLREDCATESLINSTDDCQHLSNDFHTPTHVSVSQSTSSPETSPTTTIHHFVSQNTSHTESSSNSKDEPVLPHQTETETNTDPKTYHHTLDHNITSPCTTQLPLILNSTTNAITNTDHFITNDLPSFLEENPNFESTPIPAVYDPTIASQSPGDQPLQELVTPELGLLVSDTTQARPEESLLHVNVVSVSSNVLPSINNEVTTREARRNSRRMFWDAFSTRSSTRLAEYPALLLTSEDADSTGSRRRWLLDIGDNIFDDEFRSDSLHLDRGSRYTTDRRRNSRSEFWDRLRGAATESRHRASCPLDLHSDGSCTCELDGEASALSSISRIVLLAEALFEVLDEIHHQPNFSLSLSVPAPESVVDSLPLRTYEKPCTNCGEDVDQCYICLAEYEEGEKIRVLPCRHEYHMSCVDKWLKEIHGICPLCRGEIVGKDTASSSDALAT
ncbi:uncharacterized protein LOC141597458 [Silene latifolia]|uniref:uncharacterized protein LOC141597458 n=1 Tax=Silene latifolia TaxID=37657 RepID=UPI003D77BCCC